MSNETAFRLEDIIVETDERESLKQPNTCELSYTLNLSFNKLDNDRRRCEKNVVKPDLQSKLEYIKVGGDNSIETNSKNPWDLTKTVLPNSLTRFLSSKGLGVYDKKLHKSETFHQSKNMSTQELSSSQNTENMTLTDLSYSTFQKPLQDCIVQQNNQCERHISDKSTVSSSQTSDNSEITSLDPSKCKLQNLNKQAKSPIKSKTNDTENTSINNSEIDKVINTDDFIIKTQVINCVQEKKKTKKSEKKIMENVLKDDKIRNYFDQLISNVKNDEPDILNEKLFKDLTQHVNSKNSSMDESESSDQKISKKKKKKWKLIEEENCVTKNSDQPTAADVIVVDDTNGNINQFINDACKSNVLKKQLSDNLLSYHVNSKNSSIDESEYGDQKISKKKKKKQKLVEEANCITKTNDIVNNLYVSTVTNINENIISDSGEPNILKGKSSKDLYADSKNSSLDESESSGQKISRKGKKKQKLEEANFIKKKSLEKKNKVNMQDACEGQINFTPMAKKPKIKECNEEIADEICQLMYNENDCKMTKKKKRKNSLNNEEGGEITQTLDSSDNKKKMKKSTEKTKEQMIITKQSSIDSKNNSLLCSGKYLGLMNISTQEKNLQYSSLKQSNSFNDMEHSSESVASSIKKKSKENKQAHQSKSNKEFVPTEKESFSIPGTKTQISLSSAEEETESPKKSGLAQTEDESEVFFSMKIGNNGAQKLKKSRTDSFSAVAEKSYNEGEKKNESKLLDLQYKDSNNIESNNSTQCTDEEERRIERKLEHLISQYSPIKKKSVSPKSQVVREDNVVQMKSMKEKKRRIETELELIVPSNPKRKKNAGSEPKNKLNEDDDMLTDNQRDLETDLELNSQFSSKKKKSYISKSLVISNGDEQRSKILGTQLAKIDFERSPNKYNSECKVESKKTSPEKKKENELTSPNKKKETASNISHEKNICGQSEDIFSGIFTKIENSSDFSFENSSIDYSVQPMENDLTINEHASKKSDVFHKNKSNESFTFTDILSQTHNDRLKEKYNEIVAGYTSNTSNHSENDKVYTKGELNSTSKSTPKHKKSGIKKQSNLDKFVIKDAEVQRIIKKQTALELLQQDKTIEEIEEELEISYLDQESKVEDLDIQMLGVPLIHRIAHLLGNNPTPEQRSELRSAGIQLKTGKFTKEEDEKIKRRWNQFCEEYNWNKDHYHIFLQGSNMSKRGKLSKIQFRKFVQYISYEFEDRVMINIYRRFKRLFSNSTRAHFTDQDDAIILEYVNSGKSASPFADLANILDKDRGAIIKRYRLYKSNMKNQNEQIKWDKELTETLLANLIEVTRSINFSELKNRHITVKEWQKISDKMNIPVEKLRRSWIYNFYPRIFSPNFDSEIKEAKIKLIDLLYERYNDFKEIDWDEVSKEFSDGFTPARLTKLLYDMIIARVPFNRRHNFRRAMKILRKSDITTSVKKFGFLQEILSETKQGTICPKIVRREKSVEKTKDIDSDLCSDNN